MPTGTKYLIATLDMTTGPSCPPIEAQQGSELMVFRMHSMTWRMHNTMHGPQQSTSLAFF